MNLKVWMKEEESFQTTQNWSKEEIEKTSLKE